MKRFAVVLVAASFSLSCSKTDRPHPRVAELLTPVHVTVRTIDYPDRESCDASAPALDRLKCWVAPTRAGATYVEVGDAADTPLGTTGKLDTDLDQLIGRADTRALLNRPVKKVKLLPDPASPERVVVDCGETGLVLFLNGKSLSESRLLWDELGAAPRLPSGELDWSRVARPPEPPLNLVESTREQLEAIAKTPDGLERIEDAVSAWISAEADLDDAVFVHAVSLLGPEAQSEVEVQLADSLGGGSPAVVRWYEKHPEKQSDVYTDALLRSLEYSSGEAPRLLRVMVRLKPPRMLDLACEHVEEAFFSAEGDWDGYLNENTFGALALLAHEKAKCPWVQPLLEKVACSSALVCLPLEGDFAPLDDDGRPRAGKGLCTAKEKQQAFERLFPAREDEDEDADLMDEPSTAWGPLLLLAAEQQGPLGADFVKRTARRTYLPVFGPARPAGLDSCRDLYDVTPTEWACQVPAHMSVSTRSNCRMEIDDVKHTLELTSLAPPPE